MPGIHDFDDFILGLGRPSEEPNGFSLAEAGLFLSAFRKLAADVEAQPSPLAPEYAAPPEDVVRTCLAIAAQLLHAHTAYTVYAAALRGPAHTALAEEFKSIAEGDLEDIEYFLTRANVIADGAPLQLPPVPPPPALADEGDMVRHILEGSNRLISLLKTLRVQVGEHPMKYTVEAQLDGEQQHNDRLVKLLPAGAPQAPTKVAALVAVMKRASAESVVANEAAGALAQAQNEAAFLRNQAAAQQQQTAQVQQQLEATSMQAQQAQQQLQMVQQQADMQAQQASAATEQATQAQQQAAAHADAKMRLAMRIQQFRQQLADIVSQDPVAEEGAMPEPGMEQPQTAPQQQAAADQQAQEQAAAQQSGGLQPPASAKAAKEVDQAQRAQADAEKQTAQAQQVEQEDAAKGKVAGVVARLKTSAIATVGLPEELIKERLRKIGRFAKMHGMDRGTVDAMNRQYAAQKPMSIMSTMRRNPGASLPENARRGAGRAALRGSSASNPSALAGPNAQRGIGAAPTPMATKRRTSQNFDPLALGEHIKKERGVGDAVRSGLPVRGDAATLDALMRGEGVGFGKHSALKVSGKLLDKINPFHWAARSAARGAMEGLAKDPKHMEALGDAMAAGLAKNPANSKAIGDAMAAGMVGDPERLKFLGKHVGEGAGTAGGEALDRALKQGDVINKAEKFLGHAGRIAKGTAIGAGVLGTGFLAHKGLQHYSRLRGQAQEQRRLDQQERLLTALERRGEGGRHRAPVKSTELPGAPVRNTIQPKFSSNTDIGTMS